MIEAFCTRDYLFDKSDFLDIFPTDVTTITVEEAYQLFFDFTSDHLILTPIGDANLAEFMGTGDYDIDLWESFYD